MRVRFGFCCVILAVSVPSIGMLSAQPTDGSSVWVRDPEMGLSRARYSGRAAVLVFRAHWCGHCEQLEKFFVDPKVVPICRDKTVLILVDVSRYIGTEQLRKYKVEGHHQVVVLGWDGKELARLRWSERPQQLLGEFRLAICTNESSAAETLLRHKRYRKAFERAEGVLKLLQKGEPAEKAQKVLEDIRKKTRQELTAAEEQLKDGRLGDCELACDNMMTAFPEKLVATQVRELRKGIRLARKGRPLPDQFRSRLVETAERARDFIDKAMVAEWDKDYWQAVRLYEKVVEKFPRKKAAREARARLKSLRGNPETVALIRKQKIAEQCRRLLQLARAYAASGHHEKAREYYLSVIKIRPETEWSKTARKELDGLLK